MQVFECNEELQAVLEKQGFVEITSERDRVKGKKEFRASRNSKFIIRFDYINFRFFENRQSASDFGSSVISEEDLRLLLWYLKSSQRDRNEMSGTQFKINEAKSVIKAIREELDFYKENNFSSRRIHKLSRMVSAYEAIQLN